MIEDVAKLKGDYTAALLTFANWCGMASDYIGETYGEEGLRRYYMYLAERIVRPMLETGGSNLLDMFKGLMGLLGGELSLEENAEKVVLKVIKCNTGGRMEREGISKKNKAGVTYYCDHCVFWWDELAREWGGLNMHLDYRPQGADCIFTLRKGG